MFSFIFFLILFLINFAIKPKFPKKIKLEDRIDIVAPSNYELKNEYNIEAVFFALVYAIVFFFEIGFGYLTTYKWAIYTIPLRIISAIWVKNLAFKKNRNYYNWILGFISPVFTLIAFGAILKKKSLSFSISKKDKPQITYTYLKKYANKFKIKKMNNESSFIWQYTIDNLPYDKSDIENI